VLKRLLVHFLLMVAGVWVFVDAVVDEAKLASIGCELEICLEVLGVLFYRTLLSYLSTVLPISDTLWVV